MKTQLTRTRNIVGAGVLIILIGSTAVFAAHHGSHRKGKHRHKSPLTAVQVTQSRMATVLSELQLSGLATPTQSLTLNAPSAGQLVSLNVSVGQTVSAGQTLATISSPVLEAQLASAEANRASAQAKLNSAEASPPASQVALAQVAVAKAQLALKQANQQYQTVEAAYRAGQATAASVQQAQDGVASAQLGVTQAEDQLASVEAPPSSSTLSALQASLTQAQDNLQLVQTEMSQLTVKAPFSGVVTAIPVTAGQTVSTGTALITVNGNQLVFKTSVGQSSLGLLQPGQSATISEPGHAEVQARVGAIAPSATPGSLAFSVTVTPNSQPSWMRAGEFATLSIVTHSSQSTIVPSDSLVNVNGHPQVFVVHGHLVQLQNVTPGVSDGTDTAVQGLSSGSEVVSMGQTYLAPGDKVRVTQHMTLPAQLVGASVGGLISEYTPPPVTTKGAKGGTGGGKIK